MITVFSWVVPALIPLLVVWVITLVNQDRPIQAEELDNWDNGLATATFVPSASEA